MGFHDAASVRKAGRKSNRTATTTVTTSNTVTTAAENNDSTSRMCITMCISIQWYHTGLLIRSRRIGHTSCTSSHRLPIHTLLPNTQQLCIRISNRSVEVVHPCFGQFLVLKLSLRGGRVELEIALADEVKVVRPVIIHQYLTEIPCLFHDLRRSVGRVKNNAWPPRP